MSEINQRMPAPGMGGARPGITTPGSMFPGGTMPPVSGQMTRPSQTTQPGQMTPPSQMTRPGESMRPGQGMSPAPGQGMNSGANMDFGGSMRPGQNIGPGSAMPPGNMSPGMSTSPGMGGQRPGSGMTSPGGTMRPDGTMRPGGTMMPPTTMPPGMNGMMPGNMDSTNSAANLCAILRQMPHATAVVRGSGEYPDITGRIMFYQMRMGVLVAAEVFGLPTGNDTCDSPVFGFHIHSGSTCSGNMTDPFADALEHYNTGQCMHPHHAGDMPPLFGNNGYAFQVFLTDRFTVREVIGRTVIIHSMPDDFRSQPGGDSGMKIACGQILGRETR